MNKQLTFRNSFASRYKVGVKRKLISKRTKNSLYTTPPILILDLNYFCSLLESKKKYSKKKFSVKEYILLWINVCSKQCLPKGIIGIYSDQNDYLEEVKTILSNYSISLYSGSLPNFIYSCKVSGKLLDSVCVVSNNLTCWALSNTSSDLSFIAIDSNNRSIHYNNATGLDFFCKLILTNKLINKLKMQDIKYLNLQYLYILLLYINFTNQSSYSSFFFDSKFILSLPKYQAKDQSFSRSTGLGLQLVSEAHKFLSYAFLTKSDFTDLFLLNNPDDYGIHLTRLKKLLDFDILILRKFHAFYLLNYRVSIIPLPDTVIYTLPESHSDLLFSRFWTAFPHKASTLAEIRLIVKLIRQVRAIYPTAAITQFNNILPEKEKSLLEKDTAFIKTDDTSPERSSAVYVDDLIKRFFNG